MASKGHDVDRCRVSWYRQVKQNTKICRQVSSGNGFDFELVEVTPENARLQGGRWK